MTNERWQPGWQEAALGRARDFIASSPAWFRHASPADVVEDAYLLTLASTLFLRDETFASPGQAQLPRAGPEPVGAVAWRAAERRARPIGAPPFGYERCLGGEGEAEAAFAAARGGAFGAFHQAVAERSGDVPAWRGALADLHAAGALASECPVDPDRARPTLAPLGEELASCARAVLAKAARALRIGFGLWGRWEER